MKCLRTMVLRPASLLLASLLVSGYSVAQGSTSSATMEPKEILQRESPAIVAVLNLNRAGQVQAQGSGFVVRPNGVIVTNFHVVEDAQDAQVKLKSGEIYENATVLYYDVRHDVVVLKINAIGLPTVTMGSSRMADAGDRAYAIGNPEGFDFTISDGLVSAHRVIEGTEMLQITTPISHGSSGGPLYNAQGQVIGITTAGYMKDGAQNLNFAVPLKYVLGLLDSSPRNITVAQLTAQTHPVEEARAAAPSSHAQLSNSGAYVAPGNVFRISIPSGWRVEDPPPANMLLSMSKGDRANLLVYKAAQANVDQAFVQQRQTVAKKYGEMNDCSKLQRMDQQDQHYRVQVCMINLEGSAVVVTFAALQSGSTVLGAFGLSTKDGYEDVVNAIGALEF